MTYVNGVGYIINKPGDRQQTGSHADEVLKRVGRFSENIHY